jgi:RNA polymerase sigma-B factor
VHRWLRRYRRAGDPRARELLVRRYTPLARHLAVRYARGTEPIDDLFQVACLGLLKAIDRYDPDRGSSFTGFAVPTMLGEMKRHFRDATWVLGISHSAHDLAMRVRGARVLEMQRLGREPSTSELAAWTGVDEERVAAAQRALAAYHVASLEAPRDGHRQRRGQHAVGREDESLLRVEQRLDIEDLVGCLSATERRILRLRFEDDLTQRQIADRTGLSQMTVSRLLRRALGDLRAIADERGVSAL